MANGTPCECDGDRSRSDRVIGWTTILTVVLLAAIAATVSYRHLHMLAVRHGESSWSAALLPLSVDGMILAASMALLSDSRRGKRGGLLPWSLLIIGSLASVGANVAVAEPSIIGRAVAAWPAFALIGGMEMAFRLVRCSVSRQRCTHTTNDVDHLMDPQTGACSRHEPSRRKLQREAWEWATQNRGPDGALPRSADLARRFHRSLRWARLVKAAGAAGTFAREPAG
ncbi:DUF2637 domain-containing protein [Nonomuraea angiospora]|uniref:DUF2637 domain-containing protein n=1 Tax=Nonomuraea angiospora TaxID=46172 RepID=UPI0029BE4418|nr:DUF2637 domain-containing protein [Nonomuraea angiospora]MDX3099959.1 DUF2637 domain-containing protein [Nonomuraea angiospora]